MSAPSAVRTEFPPVFWTCTKIQGGFAAFMLAVLHGFLGRRRRRECAAISFKFLACGIELTEQSLALALLTDVGHNPVGVTGQFRDLRMIPGFVPCYALVIEVWRQKLIDCGAGAIGPVGPCDAGLLGDAVDMAAPVLQQPVKGYKIAPQAPRIILGIKDVPEPQHDRFRHVEI